MIFCRNILVCTCSTIPTNKVEKGDIILVNGKPRCVIETDKTKITVINYEDSTIETVLPERHVFMTIIPLTANRGSLQLNRKFLLMQMS